MTAADILKAAKARIADPANWVQTNYAVNAEGVSVGEADPEACKFCAKGAMYAALWASFSPDALLPEESRQAFMIGSALLNDAALQNYHRMSIISVNDDLGHDAVMRCYDAAIQEAAA